MALFMHSFSWAFMIMLVPSVYTLVTTTNINNASLAIALVFLTNLCIHMVVDNSKANLKKINLVQDQLYHLAQILITWVAFVVLGISKYTLRCGYMTKIEWEGSSIGENW